MASLREYKTKAGAVTWGVLFREDGRQRSLTFRTRRDATKFKALVDSLGARDALELLQADGSERITVAELAEQYLAWKTGDVTDRTLADYRRDYANWIAPTFGHRVAEAVDEKDVQAWVDGMIKAGLSAKSVVGRHGVLHSMYAFGSAKSRGLVSHNPCRETTFPRRRKRPPKGTTVPEYRAILDAAQRRNPHAADLIVYLAETGWRWSEAAALKVCDVEDNGVDVWVSLGRVFRLDGHSRQLLVDDAAKSYAAFRRIRLFPDSAAVVRRRVAGRGLDEFVFTNHRGNPWKQHTFLSETWIGIVTDAGLYRGPWVSPTPHWLRHMHVAVLGAAGTPLQEIQRRIGHESIATTIGVYGGMIGDIDDTVLGKAAEIIAGRRFAPGVAPTVRGEVVDVSGTPSTLPSPPNQLPAADPEHPEQSAAGEAG